MCGRYYCDDETFVLLNQLINDSFEYQGANCDFCPGDTIPVIINKAGQIGIELMVWGYSTSQTLIINARCETLLEKTTFRDDAKYRRCLIPAKGFYEWDDCKHKLSFSSQTSKMLLMAGIYRENEKEVVIITTSANTVMKPIHSRMPLIIKQKDIYDWINNQQKIDDFLNLNFNELRVASGHIQQSLF